MGQNLENVDAFLFDVFGTVVDWRSSVEQELTSRVAKYNLSTEVLVPGWEADFAQEWRMGYIKTTVTTAHAVGASGTLNVDEMHREILDRMLDTTGSRWEFLAASMDLKERGELNNIWHKLNGWPDSSSGLYSLKKHAIVATLSNGNVRLLVDMAKHANLPWDVIFSTELFGTFKPNPKAYTSAAYHLSLPPSRCAMVAAHIHDLRAAAALGMRTVYIPRPGEVIDQALNPVLAKEEGGEVDIVVHSFEELASLVAGIKVIA